MAAFPSAVADRRPGPASARPGAGVRAPSGRPAPTRAGRAAARARTTCLPRRSRRGRPDRGHARRSTRPPATGPRGTIADAARPSVQRDDADSPKAEHRPATRSTNTRFAGQKRLQEIANGGSALAKGDPAAAVKPVQTALLDLGYSLLRYKDDGSFGDETAQAIAQFRTDRGVTAGDGMDANASAGSTRWRPARRQAGAALPRLRAAVRRRQARRDAGDRLRRGREPLRRPRPGPGLDREAQHDQGRRRRPRRRRPGGPDVISGADVPADDKAGLGSQSRRASRLLDARDRTRGKQSVTYPDKSGKRVTKDITITITLVPPGIGGKANYARGSSESELTLLQRPRPAGHRPRLRRRQVARTRTSSSASGPRSTPRAGSRRRARSPRATTSSTRRTTSRR